MSIEKVRIDITKSIEEIRKENPSMSVDMLNEVEGYIKKHRPKKYDKPIMVNITIGSL